jgi:hypothetical protein
VKPYRRALLALALTALAASAAPAAASAAACTPGLQLDPAVPTWDQWFADQHPIDTPLGTVSGRIPFASGGTDTADGNYEAVLYDYLDHLAAATATNPRVRIVKKPYGKTALGRDLAVYVVGTPENIANLDAGRNDGAFWKGVRDGDVSEADGLAGVSSRPAFGWITGAPHGDERAAGEAVVREMYELAARMDCGNANRLRDMDMFFMPARNPDGRDVRTRTVAWTLDPNRDVGVAYLPENRQFLPLLNAYPGPFFIDLHQQQRGYFFPPNEDPIHHEISSFTTDLIQDTIGPALQQIFNDQTTAYQNYYSYDMFTPEYGDSVPSLLMGAAGMTYEKGRDEVYAKQVYDHYLAVDQTINTIAREKDATMTKWVRQWQQAVDQGAQCKLQDNRLVSPLHDTITTHVDVDVCGYYFRPGLHEGDTAATIKELQAVGVHVYRLDTDVNVAGLHDFGKPDRTGLLPAGTLYIPMAQPMKHWIQAVLGENPFLAFPYYYDVVTWSYSLLRGEAGNGFLKQQLPPGVTMTEIGTPPAGTVPAESHAVYAFNTDSTKGLALTVDLLSKGVNVYRAKSAFDAAGAHFFTGAALVDGISLGASGADLAQLAAARDTSVTGLASYPVAHYRLARPKIGLYTNASTIPTNPLYRSGTGINGTSGHCASVTGGNSFCEALFTLTQKDGIPAGVIVPVTSADLTGHALVNGGFSALINPNGTISGAAATELAAFVNGGGVYVGTSVNGTASARNALVSNLNTKAGASVTTPGSTFDATFNTSNPIAWGFDLGGWIYRSGNGDPLYDSGTLVAKPAVAADPTATPPVAARPAIPEATAAVSYAATLDDKKYGYDVGASDTSAGQGALHGLPAVVDGPFGSGHSVLIGFNPFFRAWEGQAERIVLNAALYPTGAELPAGAPSGASVAPAAAPTAIAPAAAPLGTAKLAPAQSRPLTTVDRSDRDVRIVVARRHGTALRSAVRAANVPSTIRKRLHYVTRRTNVTLVIKGVRTSDVERRALWMSRIISSLRQRHVEVQLGQI